MTLCSEGFMISFGEPESSLPEPMLANQVRSMPAANNGAGKGDGISSSELPMISAAPNAHVPHACLG